MTDVPVKRLRSADVDNEIWNLSLHRNHREYQSLSKWEPRLLTESFIYPQDKGNVKFSPLFYCEPRHEDIWACGLNGLVEKSTHYTRAFQSLMKTTHPLWAILLGFRRYLVAIKRGKRRPPLFSTSCSLSYRCLFLSPQKRKQFTKSQSISSKLWHPQRDDHYSLKALFVWPGVIHILFPCPLPFDQPRERQLWILKLFVRSRSEIRNTLHYPSLKLLTMNKLTSVVNPRHW